MSKNKFVIFFLLLTFIAALAVGCGNNADQPPETGDNNDVEPVLTGAELVDQRCGQCHNLDRVYRERDDWPAVVEQMLGFSPNLLDEEEYDRVVEYLEENYSN